MKEFKPGDLVRAAAADRLYFYEVEWKPSVEVLPGELMTVIDMGNPSRPIVLHPAHGVGRMHSDSLKVEPVRPPDSGV